MAHEQLDLAQVKAIVKERNYGNVFYAPLRQIELNAEKGKYIAEPYTYQVTDRVVQEPQLCMGQNSDLSRAFVAAPPQRQWEPGLSA